MLSDHVSLPACSPKQHGGVGWDPRGPRLVLVLVVLFVLVLVYQLGSPRWRNYGANLQPNGVVGHEKQCRRVPPAEDIE